MAPSILIVGALENRTEALESSYTRAFSNLGYQVIRWDPVLALVQNARYGKLGALFSRFVHIEAWLRKSNLQLLEIAHELQPDLILVIGTSGIRAGTIAQIRVCVPRTTVYCLYPDSPHNLDNNRIACLPMFDRVFTSSPAWVDSFHKLGAAHVKYLPFAADTLIHTPFQAAKPIYKLGFVGTWRAEREALLEQLTGYEMVIWGSNYWKSRTKRGSALKKRWVGRSLPTSDLPIACANTSIMLNIIDIHTWPGPNMRNFELPACKAFSLVTRTPAVIEFFKEGENIECFSNVEEARSKIEYYLRNEQKRQKIATNAYQFLVEHNHNYINRAQQLLQWMHQDRNQ